MQQHCYIYIYKPSAVEPRHCYGFSAIFGKDSKSTALGLLKKFLSKSACQIVFVRGLRDPVLEFQFVLPLCVVLLCFATQSSRKSREEERTAVLPAFATPRCIPVARAAVLLACPCSFRLSGSRTQSRVRLCCSRALLTNGCSWHHRSSRTWKKCCGPSMFERSTHK